MKLNLILVLLIFIAVMCKQSEKGGIERKELLSIDMDKTELTGIKIVEISLSPGLKAPLHRHPCPVAGRIISGKCMMQVEGEEPVVLEEGEAFYEPASTPVIHFDNLSDSKPLIFVAYYLTNGETDLIEML